jgi:uncharacterized Rmd1/YagE family protein
MTIKEVMIAFKIETKEIKLVPWPDVNNTYKLWSATGANFTCVHNATPFQLTKLLYRWAYGLIVLYGFDPKQVDDIFMQIDEFREDMEDYCS